jgi:Rod binding domain-containing protein
MKPVTPATFPAQAATTQREPASKTKAAAADFEALLIAQMLRGARSSSSMTSLDGQASGSDDAITDLAEQQLSSTLASAGGLGLATLVTQGLTEPSAD